jgi:hypothetical protein
MCCDPNPCVVWPAMHLPAAGVVGRSGACATWTSCGGVKVSRASWSDWSTIRTGLATLRWSSTHLVRMPTVCWHGWCTVVHLWLVCYGVWLVDKGLCWHVWCVSWHVCWHVLLSSCCCAVCHGVLQVWACTDMKFVCLTHPPHPPAVQGQPQYSYILAPQGLSPGDSVLAGAQASIRPGNTLALKVHAANTAGP